MRSAISAAPALVKVRQRIDAGSAPASSRRNTRAVSDMRLAGTGRGGQRRVRARMRCAELVVSLGKRSKAETRRHRPHASRPRRRRLIPRPGLRPPRPQMSRMSPLPGASQPSDHESTSSRVRNLSTTMVNERRKFFGRDGTVSRETFPGMSMPSKDQAQRAAAIVQRRICLVVDRDFRVRAINREGERLDRRPAKDLIGTTAMGVLAGCGKQRTRRVVAQGDA